jgi:hypothetical protein
MAMPRTRCAAVIVALILLCGAPAWAGDGSKCAPNGLVLWGDGLHDDTVALNAWFRGDGVVWAQTGARVGPEIGGDGTGPYIFRLTGPVYIPSGTGRRIERFAFVWPQRKERVSAAAILTGLDPAKPPVAIDLKKTGSQPGEGVPFKASTPKPENRSNGTDCLVS